MSLELLLPVKKENLLEEEKKIWKKKFWKKKFLEKNF